MTRIATVIAAIVLAAMALGACAAPAARPSEPAQQTPVAQPEPTPAAPAAEESAPMDQTTDETTGDGLAGTSWTLSALDGAGPAEGGRPATLEFNSEGGLAGSTGCNRFFGGYSVDGAALTVGQMGSTRMACPEPLMAQEMVFLEILGAAVEYAVDGDTLTVTAADGRTIAFARA